MSGVSNYKDVSQLHIAYQELKVGGRSVHDVVTKLPVHIQEKVFSYGTRYSSEPSAVAQVKLSIRDVIYEIYDRESANTRAKMHGVFYRCCGVSHTGDSKWGENHIKDENRVENFLLSLELVSLERELQSWAENDPNRGEAAEGIMY